MRAAARKERREYGRPRRTADQSLLHLIGRPRQTSLRQSHGRVSRTKFQQVPALFDVLLLSQLARTLGYDLAREYGYGTFLP
jgi:hypothetical protein